MEYSTNYPLAKELKETNDCFVRALAVSAGITYKESHTIAKELFGRKDRKGTKNIQFTIATTKGKNYLKERGIVAERVNTKYTRKWDGTEQKLNIRGFYNRYPNGNYLILISNHALAVIDGEVHDWGKAKPRIGRKVLAAYRIHDTRQLQFDF